MRSPTRSPGTQKVIRFYLSHTQVVQGQDELSRLRGISRALSGRLLMCLCDCVLRPVLLTSALPPPVYLIPSSFSNGLQDRNPPTRADALVPAGTIECFSW
ncbi:hypothetical protein RRG08_040311 [Elysia crispata]|uniref:Uncharacterized protein n=1 Tax=Elysia crispata TaxID=231223 RepID=A0AAE1DNU1_9GAST|nr:hypothetical protein RRG08_040311 [Elysia crispata]